MKIKQDFFNNVAKTLRAKYFPNENHGQTLNKNYWQTTLTLENFNNGTISYSVMLKRLSKAVGEDVQDIVDEFIDFDLNKDTVIIPELIAEKIAPDFASTIHLVTKAEYLYKNNSAWRKQFNKSKDQREFLKTFMEHWNQAVK